MSTAITPKEFTPIEAGHLQAEFNAEEILDSVVLSGISGSSVTVANTLYQDMPESVRQDSSVNRLLNEIYHLERAYLPLVIDLQHASIWANPERSMLMLTGLLLIVGIAMGFGQFIGLVAALIVTGLIIFYLIVRIQVARSIRRDANIIRQQLIERMTELSAAQARS